MIEKDFIIVIEWFFDLRKMKDLKTIVTNKNIILNYAKATMQECNNSIISNSFAILFMAEFL